MQLPGVILLISTVLADRYHDAEQKFAKGSKLYKHINSEERSANYWIDKAQNSIDEKLNSLENKNKARNVIMFLGDGMSVPTLAAARILLGQRQNRAGEESQLSFEKFPTVGLAKTYCVNNQVPDSACTATAYLCGVKVNSGTLGVPAEVPRRDCAASVNATQLESIAAWALKDGRDAGIVTNTRITHASPSGAYAKSAERNWESDSDLREHNVDPNVCPDIANQLVNYFPGNQFKVILGGGRREFLPNTVVDEEGTRGRRLDNRNLIQEWQDSKEQQGVSYKYMWQRSELMDALASPPDYILGLFEGSHIPYHMEANKTTEPTLAELTELAIRSLNRTEKGFFLFVESGRIDHAHHDNFVELALDETIQMSTAVDRAIELLGTEDTLIVVTADHAHVMAFNGYTPRGGDILGPNGDNGDDGLPYMTLSYTNGPGYRPHVDGDRVDVTKETSFGSTRFRAHVDVPRDSETHGGDDVAVFAIGPHHQIFSGLYEQNNIPHLMAYAGCFGNGKKACSSAASNVICPVILLLALVTRLLQ